MAGTIDNRLAELGIELPEAAAPVAASEARREPRVSKQKPRFLCSESRRLPEKVQDGLFQGRLAIEEDAP